MIHRVVSIGRWVVDFLFAVDGYDKEGVLACIYDIGAPGYIADRVSEIMEDGYPNCGFTYSNQDEMRALCVIGPTTSGGEFVNTTSHELYHLAVAIGKSVGADLEGEYVAYLMGDTIQSFLNVICELGCEHCRTVK